MKHRFSDAQRIFVPYFASEAEGLPIERQVASLTFRVFEGKVDKRRVKRMVRRWVRDNLERTVHSRELRMLMSTMHSVSTY